MINKIPVKIAPSFFVMAGVIGFLNTFSLPGTLIWMFVIFISVLVHEYGHGLAATFFGQSAQIQLFAFGGLTMPSGKKVSRWQEFIIIAMGPLFGFGLYFATLFIPVQSVAKIATFGPYLAYLVMVTRFINLFWTIINLIPILPLDGGHLLRVVLDKFIGYKSWQVSFVISLVLSLIGAVTFFFIGQFFVGIIFLLFTFQSMETLRQFKNFTKDDFSHENKSQMDDASKMIENGDIDTAKKCLETLLYSTHEGMIHTLAKENLAKISYKEGDVQKAYELLKEEENHLSKEAMVLFYHACFNAKDFTRVIRLSGPVFEIERSSEIAVKAAKALGCREKVHEAIAWLAQAKVFGKISLIKIANCKEFDKIRDCQDFQDFLTKNQ